MTKPEYTNQRDISMLNDHRLLGQKIYGSDIDMIEYKIDDGEEVEVAIIDYKSCKASKIGETSSFRLQRRLANKLKIPFFVVIYYLDSIHDPHMYYVYPANPIAENFFIDHKLNLNGRWMSKNEYSIFQHDLRKIPQERNLNLSAEKTTYDLPYIDI